MMNRLQKLERKIETHRQSNCADCRKSITDVTAPTCPVLLDLNQRAREASRKARR